jgi:hypothetical protein
MGLFSSSEPELPPLADPDPDDPKSLLIEGVCRSWSESRFAHFLKRLDLSFASVKKRIGEDFAIVDFELNTDRRTLYHFLAGCHLSDTVFTIKPFSGVDVPPNRYAREVEIQDFAQKKTTSIHERLFPFQSLSDAERLEKKLNTFKEFTTAVVNADVPIHSAPEECLRHPHYHFSIGFDEQGKIAVGFNKGSVLNAVIVPLNDSFDIPPRILELAARFSDHVSQNLFPPYDPNSNTGKWQSVIFRGSETILMAVLTHGGLPRVEVESLSTTFGPITQSLYWVKTDRNLVGGHAPQRVIAGKSVITEKVGQLTFSIQPFTRFPTNLTIAGSIFLRISELARLDRNTVFVDLACGAGVASVWLAGQVKRSVGIDEDEHMVHAATKNAESSGVANAFFVNGSCDQILLDLAQHVSADERMVCYFDVQQLGPPVKTFATVARCARAGTFVYVGESATTFEYDCETKILAAGFRLANVELFDCGRLSTVAKIVAVFERGPPAPGQ